MSESSNRMKIAFVSDNGTTISRHFGRASQYVVIQIEEGRELCRESRPKGSCHSHHHGSSHDHHEDEEQHHGSHEDMLAAVADCDVVIAGGMGAGMDQRLRAAGLRTLRTRVRDIDEALKTFLAGDLRDEIVLVHATH